MASALVPVNKSDVKDITSDEYKHMYKMVVLGETGTGKSSFVKLLLNYAEQYGKPFNVGKVFQPAMPESSEKSWESDTISCSRYEISFGSFKLAIIDTPGLSDTRPEFKEKNTATIIEAVKKEKFVNCFCLIVNGTESRLTAVTGEVIREVTSVLPRGVLQQIIVVCTKTPKKHCLNFSRGMLKEFDIEVPREHFFYLDNPYAHWEKKNKNMVNSDCDSDDDSSDTQLEMDFNRCHLKLEKIIASVMQFEPLVTDDFGEVYELIKTIEASIAEIEIEYTNLRNMRGMLENLTKSLHPDKSIPEKTKFYTKIEFKTSRKRHLVCLQNDCLKRCHSDCNCWFTFVTPRACRYIQNRNCTNCEHSASEHKICHYYFEHVEKELPFEKKSATDDENKPTIFVIKDSFLKQSEKVVNKITEELTEKLHIFQCIGASSHFAVTTAKIVHEMKDRILSISEYKQREAIIKILDNTLSVIDNPFSAQDEPTRFRWACGFMGINPKKINKDDILKNFRKFSKIFHPDAGKDKTQESPKFKMLNLAKEILLSSNWPSMFPYRH